MNDAKERIRLVHGMMLLKWIAIASIAAFFVFLIITSPSGHPRPSKHRLTISSLQFIELGLERYYTDFGEFPQPASPDETIEIAPGKVYRIGAARCLYQALTGDGYDAIKGVAKNGNDPQSDGKVNAEEAKVAAALDLPSVIWRKVGNIYFLTDAFGRPFQYTPADDERKNPNKKPYDLWSYGEDETNIQSNAKDAESNPAIALPWIKNW